MEVKQTFPFKLYHTIEWASNSEFSSGLTWSPSGHAFIVHDRELMVENIIPKFFDHKKWRSFTRQLNLWGFKRELRGPDSEGETYYHQHFKRGKMEELQLIQRTEIKRRSITKQISDLSLPHQSSSNVVSANFNHGFKIHGPNPQQTGVDITQGASFLTGLKGAPDVLRANSVTRGGFPAAPYYGNMQGPVQMSNMIPYSTSSLPPTMQPQMMHPHMLQSQLLMQRQMMMQPQMFQGYPTGNWNPSNQLNRDMLNKMSTQQLVAMTSNMNGANSMRMNCLTERDGARTVSMGSSLSSSLSSSAQPQFDTSEEQY